MKSKILTLAAAALFSLGSMSAWATGTLHEGKILDTMNSGGYTYVQIQDGDKTIWAAGPQVEVKKGEKVSMTGAGWMKNFHSKTLNRTFKDLLFVGKINKL
ncbi:hypothetical protein NFHSH190041_12870 [Shewanella sp. NFH-SH190041]|uniref:NrfJ n=1 Tax=Shewanella sp. NFH-SH190041 TaxID=2950245 RepID=UPI0021C34D5D|nr:NrfJ [Shewanella sp. NFH-SH190041]BDM63835.1 hypothetical protein NFHSH190041_12870 [Shewanella sp. NFH-SH190041]